MKRKKIIIFISTSVVMMAILGSYFFNNFKRSSDALKIKEQTSIKNNFKSDKLSENKNDLKNDKVELENNLNKKEIISKDEKSEKVNVSNKIVKANKQSIFQAPSETVKPIIFNTPQVPSETVKPSVPITPQLPSELIKPNVPIIPEVPNEPVNPDTPSDPEVPSEPDKVFNDLIITKDDLVDGIVTISNKTYKNIFIDSSLADSKIVLDNVKIKEKLILKDKIQYEVAINNSTVPYIKVENNQIKRERNKELNINKNINGPTLQLENIKEINNVDIHGNASIHGNTKILNLHISSGILLLDAPTKFMNIDKNSNYANIT
ncbi:hypothetical protein ACSXE0_17335, partial (plasmid) [Clostridium perfringens]